MIRDRIRRAKVRPKQISLSGDGEDRKLSDTLTAETDAVDSGVLAEEMSEHLQKALEVLDPTTRQMVLQRYFGQLSFKELAEQFDCPLGTVLAKVHRGLKALRKAMGDDDTAD
jgi:RNA polymerase sigma-70 factor (ECF subfamily)